MNEKEERILVYIGPTISDCEVALSYSVDPHSHFRQNTIPLVNVRATLLMLRILEQVLGSY
jgi:hypothetical protein